MCEKLDSTIEAISEWIIKDINSAKLPSSMMPEMILALAELIKSRATLNHFSAFESSVSKTV